MVDARTLDSAPLCRLIDNYNGHITALDDGASVGPAELKQACRAIVNLLSGKGVRPSDKVLIAVGNGPRFAAAFCAAIKVGACPLLVHFETPMQEAVRFAEQYAAKFLLTDTVELRVLEQLGLLPKSAVGIKWLETLSCVGLPGPHLASFMPLVGVPLHPTSGTTGTPMVAVRPAAAAIAEAMNYARTLNIGPADVILAVAPMSHAYAYGMCWMVPLLTGASIATMRRFAPRRVLAALKAGEVSIFPAVPAMLDVIPQLTDNDEHYFSKGVQILSAGAPLRIRTAECIRVRYGVRVKPLYGTTETGGISICTGGASQEQEVGNPMGTVSVALASSEPSSAEHELMVSSSSMMSGYLTPAGEIDSTMIQDGWFNTRDLARITADGAIVLCGRSSDTINVLGLKVSPLEVEDILLSMRGVREAVVYAGRQGPGEAIVNAAVVCDGDVDERALRAHCKANLAPYKRPQIFHFLDHLPKSGAGKVLRAQLPR